MTIKYARSEDNQIYFALFGLFLAKSLLQDLRMKVDTPFLGMWIHFRVLPNQTARFQSGRPIDSERTNQHESSLLVLYRFEKTFGRNYRVDEHGGGQTLRSSGQMIDGFNSFDSAASIVRRSQIANKVVESRKRITVADLF
jgi:hypothetical protein